MRIKELIASIKFLEAEIKPLLADTDLTEDDEKRLRSLINVYQATKQKLKDLLGEN